MPNFVCLVTGGSGAVHWYQSVTRFLRENP